MEPLNLPVLESSACPPEAVLLASPPSLVSWEAGLCGPQQPSGSSGSGWIQPMRTPVVVVVGGSERHICPSVWSLTLWPLWTTCVPVARGHGFSPSTQPVVFPAYGNCSLPLPLGPKCANPPPSTSPRCGIIPCGSLHLSMLYKFVPSLNSDQITQFECALCFLPRALTVIQPLCLS